MKISLIDRGWQWRRAVERKFSPTRRKLFNKKAKTRKAFQSDKRTIREWFRAESL